MISENSDDADLRSIANARDLVRRASAAGQSFHDVPQETADAVTDAMATAATRHAEELAVLAVEETGMGRIESKVAKNLFVSKRMHEFFRDLRTCGVIRVDRQRGLVEVASPVGVVAGILPTTNPTSTAIFKALIAVKGRNPVVLSPHPRAERSIRRTVEILHDAAVRAGAPNDLILTMEAPTLEGTHELMRHPKTAVVVATGGPGVVAAAYSSGKPAFGVGPGNPPVFVHGSANLEFAARCLVRSQNFDYGTLCSSEQSLVVEQSVREPFRQALVREGARFLEGEDARRLEATIETRGGGLNTAIVGQSAVAIAALAGVSVAENTTLLIAPGRGVGPGYPLSREKLCPVLAWYDTEDWRSGCELAIELIRYGGNGHTLGIYSRDAQVITKFAVEKPVARIVVNGPTSQGSIGDSTDLDPSMTLGCGTMGGNITTDNIGPRHLVNVKRVALPRVAWFQDQGLELESADRVPDLFGGPELFGDSKQFGARPRENGPESPSPEVLDGYRDPRRAKHPASVRIGARVPPPREYYLDEPERSGRGRS